MLKDEPEGIPATGWINFQFMAWSIQMVEKWSKMTTTSKRDQDLLKQIMAHQEALFPDFEGKEGSPYEENRWDWRSGTHPGLMNILPWYEWPEVHRVLLLTSHHQWRMAFPVWSADYRVPRWLVEAGCIHTLETYIKGVLMNYAHEPSDGPTSSFGSYISLSTLFLLSEEVEDDEITNIQGVFWPEDKKLLMDPFGHKE